MKRKETFEEKRRKKERAEIRRELRRRQKEKQELFIPKLKDISLKEFFEGNKNG